MSALVAEDFQCCTVRSRSSHALEAGKGLAIMFLLLNQKKTENQGLFISVS